MDPKSANAKKRVIKVIDLAPGEKVVALKYRENIEREHLQLHSDFNFVILRVKR